MRGRGYGLLKFTTLLLASAFLSGVVTIASFAQADRGAQAPPLRSSTEIVKIEASVVDVRGEFLSGLMQSDFRVLDDGVEQSISFFAPVDTPAQVLVLVETGPAVYLIHNEHLAALYALVGGLAPDDQIALAAFDQKPRMLLPFTSERAVVLSAIDGLDYSIGMGELNFYDAVSSALEWTRGTSGKRSLLVLATGLDTSSGESWDRLEQRLRRSDTVIFTVALGASLRGGPRKKPKRQTGAAPNLASPAGTPERTPFQKADDALNSLARITGGKAYFPQTAAEFAPIYRETAAALRHQYVLGIRAAADGQFHHLTVELSGDSAKKPQAKDRHRIFAREGYIAPGP